ncbi:MAG: fatty acid desaturase [Gammaproteobacteria bacterium]|nr:fatty acid desaturase [Gammaproteobacteria bacterium]
MSAARTPTAPINGLTMAMFAATTAAAVVLVPWYGFAHGYRAAEWIWFAAFLSANELAITCGYHRLFAHSTYEARPVLRLVYLLLGAMALQNSALKWSADHRKHHRYIDDPDRDPYCARRGFWFSHIGWMLRDYPSGDSDLNTVRDLQRDPLVMWQHRHYLAITIVMNVGVPLLIGWWSGDVVGMLLLVGVLRLVVSHHFTFFINSLAHMWGSQPYTEENTARDNFVLAFLTYGEGYHNFHHMFAHDYRNGVRLWQWDPSKWFIRAMQGLGLAYGLKRVPWFKIQRAILDAQFRSTERQLARNPGRAQVEHLRRRVAEEYEAFCRIVSTWSDLREQLANAKRAVAERWERSTLQLRLRELEYELRFQRRRMRVLQAQLD